MTRRRQALSNQKESQKVDTEKKPETTNGRIKCPGCGNLFKPQGYGRHRTVCKGKT